MKKAEEIQLSQRSPSPDISWEKRESLLHLNEPNEENSRIKIDEGHNDIGGWDYKTVDILNYFYPPEGFARIEEQAMWPSVGILAGDMMDLVGNGSRVRLIFDTASILDKLSQNISLEFDIECKDGVKKIDVSGEETLRVLQKSCPPEIITKFKLIGIKRKL